MGRRPPNRRYTYGYGRAEDLAGIFIVAMIALSAGVAAWQAIARLVDPQTITNPGWVAAAGVVGFVGNELVASYRIRVGRRIGSAALVADGLHARTDGLTSLAVLAAALGTMAGWRLADPIVGLAISAAILKVLHTAARDIHGRLMDRVDPALVDGIEHELAQVEGIDTVDQVLVRWIGHELDADADVAVDRTLELAGTHDILEDARHHLLHTVPRGCHRLLHRGERCGRRRRLPVPTGRPERGRCRRRRDHRGARPGAQPGLNKSAWPPAPVSASRSSRAGWAGQRSAAGPVRFGSIRTTTATRCSCSCRRSDGTGRQSEATDPRRKVAAGAAAPAEVVDAAVSDSRQAQAKAGALDPIDRSGRARRQ